MKEFIILMAFLMALVALSIDAMLPALGLMAHDLGVARANDIQYVIGFIFIGMTLGQIFYGPLADSIGRKRALNIGLLMFIAGCLISWKAESLGVMLLGRFIQGLGVSAPRIVTTAIVRDRFEGREMARVMSVIMGVFIMVPAIAPTLGQAILHIHTWHMIFLVYVAAAIVGFLWAHCRLAESLTPENRRPFSLDGIWLGAKEAVRTRVTLGYTICSGLAFGGLLGYLQSAQQIFQDIFISGDKFAIYFGLLALAIGAAFFLNSALVRRYGMHNITYKAIYALIAASSLFAVFTFIAAPILLIFMLFAGTAFFCLGLTFGNMNAIAMQPMGHMAGLASAFIGSLSSLISILLGTLISQSYNGTLQPLALGFLVLSVATYSMMRWTDKSAPVTA